MRNILSLQNKWWTTKEVPKEFLGTFKRDIFTKLVNNLKEKKITSILGPRRVGKTTLQHQLIDNLLKTGVDEKRILFLQFDVIEIRQKGIIKELVTILSERLNEPLDELSETIYLFLDEVHKLENWAEEIKQFQDMKLKIKFIVSGSSSLRIIKGAGESLLGRINHFLIYPLNFREYLSIKNIKVDPPGFNYTELKKTQSKLIDKTNKINLCLREYLLKGGYPEIVDKGLRESFRLLLDYKDLSLQRDLFEMEGVRDVKSIRELLNVLASLAAERITYSKLASILGIKADTVKRYLGLLEDIYLLHESKVFSRKPYFSVRKERKVFLIDNGMLNAMSMRYEIEEEYMPKLIENTCIRTVLDIESEKSFAPSVNYWLDEFGKEIDIILENDGAILPIEVKFKNQIIKKDLQVVKKFLKQFGLKKGIIITKDLLDKQIIEAKETLFIPAWLFLLTV